MSFQKLESFRVIVFILQIRLIEICFFKSLAHCFNLECINKSVEQNSENPKHSKWLLCHDEIL